MRGLVADRKEMAIVVHPTTHSVEPIVGPLREPLRLVVHPDPQPVVRAGPLLDEAARHFYSAFRTSPIGMALVELDGSYSAVNPALANLLGYDLDELQSMTCRDIVHPDDLDDGYELLRAITDEPPSPPLDHRYLTADGQVVWVNVSASTVDGPEGPDGPPRYVVLQVVDVTGRKETEQQLLQYARQLARSNSELVEFASVAAHDLSQPLRAIDYHLRLLGDHLAGSPDESGRCFVDQALEAAARLQEFIDDLLTYARSTDTRVAHGRVDLAEVTAAALASLAVQVAETDATVEVGSLPTVIGHPRQLEQLVQNLVGNALRFAAPGDPPRVTVSAEPADDGWILTVADRGIGIPPDQREQVFGMFRRLDTRPDGTGIGLAICRKVAESHGGRIWIDDADIGARIRVWLPSPRQ